MSQVSYGTITIVDTTDIGRIYMVYAKSVSNTTPPSDELTWSESIASAPGEGDFIWQKTVVEKAITEEKTYSDPVCVTGSSGQGVEKIINYYCNYGQGQPEEDYSGWQLEIPEYDESKPNYWTKVVVIYGDDTREDFQSSGAIATFESEKVGILDSLEVTLNPKQSGSGTPSPSNVRPISGWDEVETVVSGVNVWDEEWEQGTLSTADGSNVARTTRVRSANYISVVPNETYYFKIGANGLSNGLAVCFYDRNKTFISGTWQQRESITIPNNARYVRFSTGDLYGGTYNNDISINHPFTDQEYHAYDGETYHTTLPQTVYGGTLDVVSGVLTVDRAIVDLGTLNWTYESARDLFEALLTPRAKSLFDAVCSSYRFVGSYSVMTDKTCGYIYGYHVAIKDSTYGSDTTAFKTAMSGVQLVYELATPTTIQCDPQTVQTLIGDNNVWGDGTVEVRGHTISKRDVMIYKDNGLTDVVDKSAEANTNAAEALEKANDGIVSTTQLWYQTNSTSALSVPTSHSQVDQGTITYNNWRSARPSNSVDSYKYYYYCYEYLHGDGTYTYSTEAILDTSNLSQYQIGALTTKVRNYWWDSAGAHIASGTSTSGEINATSPTSSYGYNTLTGLSGISFKYNDAKVVDLNSEVPSLDFYTPPVIENNLVTANGKLAMRLNESSLNFYNPEDGETIQASLSTNGLIIQNGSIRLGNSNSNIAGSITLSNQNFSRNINNITREDLRFAIGSNFGIKDDGTLYASNVDIEGAINVNDKLNSNIYTKEEVNSGLEDAAATATNFIKTSIDGSGIRIAAQNTSAYLLITDKVLRFYLNNNVMSQFGYDDIFESYGVQAENIFIKGAGNALRLDNNVNGTYQGQYILETRANGHLSLKPGLRRTEEE